MEQTPTKRPPFDGWKDFARDFAAHVNADAAADLFLAQYRAEQDEGALCAICGQRYVPDCNSGVCS